jgi:[ribosomal protein S5]-alanine N-acetyltransferase
MGEFMEILIETERLLLRQFTEGDAEALCEVCNQDYILKRMPDWEGAVEQKKTWIRWVVSQYATANKNTARVILAVVLKDRKTFIGMVGIGNKAEVNNEIEIAYFISEQYSNQGYITEAVKALSNWVFQTLQLDYLIAIVELDNVPSQRVLTKCGFTKLATKMILNSGETEEKPFYYYRLYHS